MFDYGGTPSGKTTSVGVHFSMKIWKYGNTDPYSIFYTASIRLNLFIKVT